MACHHHIIEWCIVQLAMQVRKGRRNAGGVARAQRRGRARQQAKLFKSGERTSSQATPATWNECTHAHIHAAATVLTQAHTRCLQRSQLRWDAGTQAPAQAAEGGVCALLHLHQARCAAAAQPRQAPVWRAGGWCPSRPWPWRHWPPRCPPPSAWRHRPSAWPGLALGPSRTLQLRIARSPSDSAPLSLRLVPLAQGAGKCPAAALSFLLA